MTTYRAIASSEYQPKAPVTSELMQALALNHIATAEGSSGAPTMEVAWHEIETVTLGSDGDAVTFTTDISGYRAIRLRGGSKLSGTGLVFRIDLQISAAWNPVVQKTLTNNAVLIDAEVDNIDGDGGSSGKIAVLRLADFNIVSGDWDASDFSADTVAVMGYRTAAAAATGVRLKLGSGTFDISEGGTSITLFGIKRTQP